MRWIRFLIVMLHARFRSSLKVTDESVLYFRVWVTDIDVSVMNHAAMMTAMEMGRIDFMIRTGFFKLANKNKWYTPSAAISVQFFRPLKIFQKAMVKTRVFYMNERWIYIEQKISRQGKEIACCIVKSTIRKGRQFIDTQEVLHALRASHTPREGWEIVDIMEEENRMVSERSGLWDAH